MHLNCVESNECGLWNWLTNAPAIWKSSPPTFRTPQPDARVGLFVGWAGTIGSSRWLTPRQQTSSTSWQSSGSKRISMIPKPVTASSSAISLTVLLLGSHMWYGMHVHCWLLLLSIVCGAVVGTNVGSGVTITPKPRFGVCCVLNTSSMAFWISGFAGSAGSCCCRCWRKCCGTAFIVFMASNKPIVSAPKNGLIFLFDRGEQLRSNENNGFFFPFSTRNTIWTLSISVWKNENERSLITMIELLVVSSCLYQWKSAWYVCLKCWLLRHKLRWQHKSQRMREHRKAMNEATKRVLSIGLHKLYGFRWSNLFRFSLILLFVRSFWPVKQNDRTSNKAERFFFETVIEHWRT